MKFVASTGLRRGFRPLLMACVALLALPLIAASTNVLINAPVVVVYPLGGAQGVPADVGSSVSAVLADQIAQSGGVVVKPAPPGTQQSDFLATSRKLGTDYYVSGFVSPLGDQVSVVEQLVSAKSGTVVWSTTTQIAVYGDARASGRLLHDAILQYAGRGFAALDQQQVLPASSASPARKPAAVAAAPVPTPASRTAAILQFDGPAPSDVKRYTPASIIRTIRQYGVDGSPAPIDSQNVGSFGPVLCAQNNSDLLLGGTIAVGEQPLEMGSLYAADIRLTGYDCSNLAAKPRTVEAAAVHADEQTAIDIAVSKALKAYMNPKVTSLKN